MNIKHSPQSLTHDEVSFGNVYIMTHSLFSDVIRIGCTPNDTIEYAKSLSSNIPGQYNLYFSLACNNPCKIKQQMKKHFEASKYVNEFYEVAPETAKTLLQREVLKIPTLKVH